MKQTHNIAVVRSPRAQFWDGVKAQIPNTSGIMPFGMLAGAFTASVLQSQLLGVLYTSGVFAGRAQMAAMQLVLDKSPIFVPLAACVVINLRHLMYGAALSEYFRHVPLRWKIISAFLMTDLSYIVGYPHFRKEADTPNAATSLWYYMGASVTNWGAWSTGGVIGALIGAQIPPSWSLDLVPTFSFIAALVNGMRDRAGFAAGVSAGIIAVIFAGLPWSMGLFISAIVGLIVGLVVEQRNEVTA